MFCFNVRISNHSNSYHTFIKNEDILRLYWLQINIYISKRSLRKKSYGWERQCQKRFLVFEERTYQCNVCFGLKKKYFLSSSIKKKPLRKQKKIYDLINLCFRNLD